MTVAANIEERRYAGRTMLYVGTVWPGSTCRARMNALSTAGLEITAFDTTPYVRNSSFVSRQLLARFAFGPAFSRLNADVLSAAAGRRFDYVWVDKGVWIHPDTLRVLKCRSGGRLVHYTPDPQIVFQREKQRHFVASAAEYDVLFTTKPFEMNAYRALGADNIHLIHQSYDDDTMRPLTVSDEERRSFGSDVCFIGQFEEQRATYLSAVAQDGVRLRFWGPNWRRRLARESWAERSYSGDGVWGRNYALALNASKIALCFLSKRIPETTTTRSVEIPACGAFLLAERTADHLSLFDEGREAEFFTGEDELRDKIRFYLAHECARAGIAARGRERCLKSGYGNRARMRSLLSIVDASAGLRSAA